MKKPSCKNCWLLDDPSTMQKEWANGVSGKPKNFGVKMKSTLPGVLGHTCPSRAMVRYQLIVCVCLSQVSKTAPIQHAIIIVQTIQNTRNIRDTTLSMIFDRPERAPNRILSMGPRL